ncbi:e745b3e4-8926-48f6-82fa-600dbed5c2b6 [Thermothielavioides terrestris]|jgi:hypothetical protein
MELP